jgi:hypothetical protein
VIEVVVHAHDAAFAGIAIGLDQFEQFDLIEGVV